MSERFHDSDCAMHNSPAYPAGECDCRLAELDKWEAAYNAVCDERDAIAKDCDKAYALLRQALESMEELQYATTDKAFAMADATIAAIKERLK